MKKKYLVTALLILIASGLAMLNWGRLCYFKGQMDANLNLRNGKRVTYGYGLAKPYNDTTWIADSLIYSKYGFEGRGSGCVIGSSFSRYIDGYNSVYQPSFQNDVYPKAETEAKQILAQRPRDWKLGLSPDQKRARLLLFEAD